MKALDWGEILRLRDEKGLTFQEIADRMGKTRGSIGNAYKRAKAEGSKPSLYPKSKLPSKPKPEAEEGPAGVESKPEVYQDSKLEGLLPELEEIVSWWRQRKKALSKPTGLPKKRQTYILSQELIDGVRKVAQQKGITLTEAVNEVIRRGLL